MPYLRIYSPSLSLPQKRLIAQKLLEIASRSFHLGEASRHRTNIQFITVPRISSVTGLEPEVPPDASFFVEVGDRDLTEDMKGAFDAEVKSILSQVLAPRLRTWLALLPGVRPRVLPKIAVLFNEGIRSDLESRDRSSHGSDRRVA